MTDPTTKPLNSDATTDLDLVIEAAERYQRELLGQASKYESLGMMGIARETMDEHYLPLKRAIANVRRFREHDQPPDAS